MQLVELKYLGTQLTETLMSGIYKAAYPEVPFIFFRLAMSPRGEIRKTEY